MDPVSVLGIVTAAHKIHDHISTPGGEDEFVVDNNPFAFTPGQLSKLLNPKSLKAFYNLGGLQGLEKGLSVDRQTGWPARSAVRKLSAAKSYSIAGLIDDLDVTACWDTGSNLNIVSEDLANRQGLQVDTSKARSFRLPNRSIATSVGQTTATFRFRGELEEHEILFDVVPRCPESVILGLGFLQRTDTLSRRNRHRIQETSRPCMQKGGRLFFVDDKYDEGSTNKRTLPFTVNGQHGNALPDSGSDIMAISGPYARRCGFEIDRTCRMEVALADGTKMMTSGMVWDAALEFEPSTTAEGWEIDDYSNYMEGLRQSLPWGGSARKGSTSTTIICDLHVIENLPCDLILSTQFIMDNRGLLQLQDDEMGRTDDWEQAADVFAMRYGKDSVTALLKIKTRRKQDQSSANENDQHAGQGLSEEEQREMAQKEEEDRLVQQEIAMRDEEYRLIRSRPAPERKGAITIAHKRRRHWERSLVSPASSRTATPTSSTT